MNDFDIAKNHQTNRRIIVDELMDSPRIAQADHLRALAGLKRINGISGVARQMARPILDLARADQIGRLSLLDIACGGGDVSIAVARRLRSAGIEIHLTFLDKSDTALAQAGVAAKKAQLDFDTLRHDALDMSHLRRAEIITNSLFLHHLRTPEQVVDLLRRHAAGWLVGWR